jgi:hypothetical protein
MSRYVPSKSDPSKVWSIGVYKPQRGNAVVSAVHGVYEKPNGSGFASFSTMLFQDLSFRQVLTGRNTPKNREAALLQLRQQLIDGGHIAEDEEFPTDV